MEGGRVLLILLFLAVSCIGVQCKVYKRCELTRELLKNNFPRTFISNWVCLAEQVSDRNTALLTTKTARKKYYGIFQIGSEWCKEGRRGGRCDIACEALLDDDIRDDGVCAMKVFEEEGFKYWSKWEARCKGQILPDIEKSPGAGKLMANSLLDDDIRDDGVCAMKVFEEEGFKYWSKWEVRCKGQILPDIEKCPDWQHPPGRSSVSPSRDKRNVQGTSMGFRKFLFLLRLNKE